MTVAHGVYALILSAVYFVVALVDREVAEALTIAFVALIVLPGPVSWFRRRDGRA